VPDRHEPGPNLHFLIRNSYGDRFGVVSIRFTALLRCPEQSGSSSRLLSAMTRYSNVQIAIHWAVVAMISAQWATSSAIPRTHNPLLPASEWDLLLHAAHNYVGIAIGATVLARVALRLARRADGMVHDRVPAEFAAVVVHWGIYAALAVQAASGFVASYLWLGAVAIHKAAWKATG